MKAQTETALRSRFGHSWPLKEFWKDNVKEHREIVDRFVEPFLHQAIANKLAKERRAETEGEMHDVADQTLLDHMINHTQGL